MHKSTVTQGPWFVRQPHVNGVVQAHYLVEADGKQFPVCRVQMETSSTLDSAEANARLISAAPEMLEVCEMALNDALAGELTSVEALRAVITKAKGGE